jgi:hypothetical protein
MAAMSMVPFTAPSRLCAAFFCGYAPEAMGTPCAFLAFFAAVLRPPASSALSELASILFPFAALPICALPNATSALVFAAQISHHDASPVLHITLLLRSRVVRMAGGGRFRGGEFLDKWEDVVGHLARLLHELVVPFFF